MMDRLQVLAMLGQASALLSQVQALIDGDSEISTTQAPSEPKYQFDKDGLLLGGTTAANGGRIDPIVGPDCPRTVVLPKTGHVVSIARPDLGEMLLGYAIRVSAQTKMLIGQVGLAAYMAPPGLTNEPWRWPEFIDRLANPQAYA